MANTELRKDLTRISVDTMADIVDLHLREYFKKKQYKPGDALPKEIELADALGVSRNVVREALSRFRMLGMIETRKHRGMVLSRPDILGSFERVLDPMIIDDATLQDIFELRLAIEMGLADMLFLRKKEEDVLELEEIAKKEVPGGEIDFRIKNEIAFHGKLYEMAGNDTLKRFQVMLLPIFGYVVSMEKPYKPGPVKHIDLVEILKTGTQEEFRAKMREHLKPHFDRLKDMNADRSLI